MRKLVILLTLTFAALFLAVGCGEKANPPPPGQDGGTAKVPGEQGKGGDGPKAMTPQ